MFHSIEKLASSSKSDSPVCLVIDDLSVLLSLGVKLSEVVSFISYCRQMLLSPDGLCHVYNYRPHVLLLDNILNFFVTVFPGSRALDI